ncbi:uncharacterized protein LOC125240764 isoform X1 [Leguminivora glycinivorella]|uniref:uncharacterized protein LOC125240764 isoform X1 n=2 Tax=Leguminivora glycinivorella TaxID=1035111 RepID=UPI00200BF66B|nr:uncharacterized protein LOC125240764 isoform X1 [Leguminivora glycinivorella]
MRLQFDSCFLWSDSTIVLGWLSMHPSKLQTFIRNRIAEIQSTCANHTWRHVPTNENPADHISRGLTANEIVHNKLWWNGPQFLSQPEHAWPQLKLKLNTNNLPEVKTQNTCLVVNSGTDEPFPFSKFSDLKRMQRIFAYMARFIHNARFKNDKRSDPLSAEELDYALKKLILISQKESFPTEYDKLKSGTSIKKSTISSLNPYIDTNDLDLIRVGGRLSNSDYEYDKVHPILLSKNHRITKLLFECQHKALMHAGPQHLLYSIRERYWPIGGRGIARSISHQCVTCRRFGGRTVTPIMGNLPKQRLQPGSPFLEVNVDYAGPVMMANRRGRGCRLIKAYICIFVCCKTKAIHIELVGDLSTANFIAALKRFIARRGKPLDIFCDNGSNFVGAANELKSFIAQNATHISDAITSESINFHFLPPHAPHFGGLHEAGVRSIKHHLRRVLGSANLVYEDLYSTLTYIEALLNSRPLTPLSSDQNDLLPLTPGHFIIGRSMTAIPEEDLTSRTRLVDRYQKIQQLRQHFWARWQLEYISELQIRTKWRQSTNGQLEIGTLVVIKDKQQPPIKWLLGRIQRVFPGHDGVTRVAEIQTATGLLRRDFTKICPLPVGTTVEDDTSRSAGMSRTTPTGRPRGEVTAGSSHLRD